MISCRAALSADFPKLIKLWTDVFEEPAEAVELFLNRNKDYLHAYVAEENDVVSALYLVDCALNGKAAHYLCGVATEPGYRKRGIMTKLLEYALNDAGQRGDVYSVLYPANTSLYSYYAKRGYLPKCKTAVIAFERRRLEAGENAIETAIETAVDYQTMQNFCFKNNFLLWNNKFMEFAIDYYSFYGTKILRGKGCLAFYDEENGTAQVFYSVYNDFKELKSLLLKNSKADKFVFYTKSNLFSAPDITVENAGMVRLLDKTQPLADNIYIGITLN